MTFQKVERPADIAATVRKRAALQSAEMRFAKASQSRDEFTARLREAIKQTYGKGDDSGAREIRAIEEEIATLDDRLRPLAMELRGLRVEHAAAIAKALTPMRKLAAERVIAAIGDLRECLGLVDACAEQFSRAGGGDGFEVPMLTGMVHGVLHETEEMARRIVGGS